jgi:membrane protein
VAGFLDRLEARFDRGVVAARARSSAFDHFWRAQQRYFDVDAGRLAAASTYYGFFSVFAMAVILFVILGRLFRGNTNLVQHVQTYLTVNLPQLDVDQVLTGSQKVGIIAIAGLVIGGVGWVENLRSSQRAIWRLDEQPGNVIFRWLIDLGVLVGLGILLLASIAIYSGVQEAIYWLAGDVEQDPVRVALRGTTTISSGLVDLVLGAALLAGVPRLRLSLRRLWPSALLFAIGLGLLKTLGKWYITRTERNPAYQLVAGTVGLLLFMYVLHRILLFAAALAATSTKGRARDLAGGKPPPDLRAVAQSAENAAAFVEQAAESAERAATAAEKVTKQAS